jgi:hypothetical protein
MLAVGLAVTALLSACGQSNSPGADARDFAKRAKSVAAAWRSSGAIAAWRNGLVPLGDLTQVISFDDSDLKVAFAQGRIGLQGTLDDTKASGVVTFPDGTTMPVALVGGAHGIHRAGGATGRPCAATKRCARRHRRDPRHDDAADQPRPGDGARVAVQRRRAHPAARAGRRIDPASMATSRAVSSMAGRPTSGSRSHN